MAVGTAKRSDFASDFDRLSNRLFDANGSQRSKLYGLEPDIDAPHPPGTADHRNPDSETR